MDSDLLKSKKISQILSFYKERSEIESVELELLRIICSFVINR